MKSSLAALLLTLAGACAHPAPAPTPAPAPASPPAAAPPAKLDAVVVKYGLMTFVMDSPGGQREKAEAAVKRSALASQLASTGAAVTFTFDQGVGDDVVVVTPAGDELGRVPLHDLDRDDTRDAAAAIVAKVQARR